MAKLQQSYSQSKFDDYVERKPLDMHHQLRRPDWSAIMREGAEEK